MVGCLLRLVSTFAIGRRLNPVAGLRRPFRSTGYLPSPTAATVKASRCNPLVEPSARLHKGDVVMLRRSFAKLAIPVLASGIVTTATLPVRSARADHADNIIASRDPFGELRTVTTNGVFDVDNLFFRDLGTNGR